MLFVRILLLLCYILFQKRPKRTEKPSTMSHTICTKSNAWPDRGTEPPFPTSQNPIFATCTPAHAASLHPHQYVTPSTPQTGSVRKHFTGHDDGATPPHIFFPWSPATSLAVTGGRTQRAKTVIKTAK